MSNFAQFLIGTRDQGWRAEFARPYVLREAIYASLYAFISAVQGMCIEAYRETHLYRKEDHWGILVPLPNVFVDVIRTEGLDAPLDGSKFDNDNRSSQVK